MVDNARKGAEVTNLWGFLVPLISLTVSVEFGD